MTFKSILRIAVKTKNLGEIQRTDNRIIYAVMFIYNLKKNVGLTVSKFNHSIFGKAIQLILKPRFTSK